MPLVVFAGGAAGSFGLRMGKQKCVNIVTSHGRVATQTLGPEHVGDDACLIENSRFCQVFTDNP